MPLTVGESFYETLLQYENTPYTIKDTKFLIHKVMPDHFVLKKETGEYFIVPFHHVKFIKTTKGGNAVDWIVFHDNKQIPT